MKRAENDFTICLRQELAASKCGALWRSKSEPESVLGLLGLALAPTPSLP